MSKGLDAPLEDVARRAGVGIATLYRRYPTREGLVVACFKHRLDEYAAALDEAWRHPTPGRGSAASFCGFVERACAMQTADRASQDLLTTAFPTAREIEAQRARGYERFAGDGSPCDGPVFRGRRSRAEGSVKQAHQQVDG